MTRINSSAGALRALAVPMLVLGTAAFAQAATAQQSTPQGREAQQDATRETREAGREATQETREAGRESRSAARQAGNAISDSWLTMKIHSQFVPEDALDGSDIDVDTNGAVVTLTGTVPTASARTRAVAIAKATDGVQRVEDKLRIAPAGTGMAGAAGREPDTSAREAGREAGAATREAGREAGADTRETARDARGTARETAGTTGKAVTDGWLKSKIYAQFIAEDALENSDIDVDVRRGVVTLNGTVRNEADIARAAAIAKATDGVASVQNTLKVAAATR